MPVFARVAIAAAAVVGAVVIGVNLLGNGTPTTGGPAAPSAVAATSAPSTTAPTSTPSAPSTAAATSSPSSSAPIPASTVNGAMDPGAYIVDSPVLTPVPMTFTVPAGWLSLAGGFFGKVGTGDRQELFNVQMGPWIVTNLYADDCDWSGNELDPPVGPTAEDLAMALVAQGGKRAAGPTDVTIGGYPAKRVELVVPAARDLSACDGGQIARWYSHPSDKGGYPHSYGVGQRNVVYIVETPNGRLVIDTSIVPEATAAQLAELEDVVASIGFAP